ncbi:MAG: hypothetical protein ABL949_06155 [Fimbriimonadaceae bacterium]
MVALALSYLTTSHQSAEIAEIRAKLATAKTNPGAFQEANELIVKCIESDAVKSAADYSFLSRSYWPSQNRLQGMRVKYELSLAALCMGDPTARKDLAVNWNLLMGALDRPYRFKNPPTAPFFGSSDEKLTAQTVRDIWSGHVPRKQSDNLEVKKLFDADQKARQSDFSKFTMKDFERFEREDRARLSRARQILAKGNLFTGADFERTAFIFQHSDRFADYATAHELGVCAFLLGNKSASWIAGAAYDRMMLRGSYPQRFGTQFYITNGKAIFDNIDESVMNDSMRKAVIRKTLKEAREQKFN